MISLSRRYVVSVSILCLVAALPVYVHSAGVLTRDDCADPEALLAASSIPGTELQPAPAGQRARGTLQRSSGTVNWAEQAPPLRFGILRNYQPVRLLNPPQRLAQAFQVEHRTTRPVVEDGVEIPIHWAFDNTQGATQFAAYAFVFRGRPQRSPMGSLFRSTLTQLTTGARPFTLFVVGGPVPRRLLPVARQAGEDWLVAAWRHYDAVCNTEPPPGG